MTKERPKLVLIRGGAEALGPVSRMGLWDRFPDKRRAPQYWMLLTKLLLLSSLIYFVYPRA